MSTPEHTTTTGRAALVAAAERNLALVEDAYRAGAASIEAVLTATATLRRAGTAQDEHDPPEPHRPPAPGEPSRLYPLACKPLTQVDCFRAGQRGTRGLTRRGTEAR